MIYTPDKFVFEFGVTPMAHPAAWAPVILLYILFSFLLAVRFCGLRKRPAQMSARGLARSSPTPPRPFPA